MTVMPYISESIYVNMVHVNELNGEKNSQFFRDQIIVF